MQERPPAASLAPIRFSTDRVRWRDRFDVWREQVGRRIVHSDFDTPDKDNFRAEIRALPLPNIAISRTSLSVPSIMQRTRAMLRDGDDDLVFFLCFGSACDARVGEKFYRLEPGSGMLVSNHLSSGNYTRAPMTGYSLRLPRAVAKSFVPSLEDALYRAIPGGDPAIVLLKSYMEALLEAPDGLAAPMVALADCQLRELLAHIVNPAGDLARAAAYGGVKAARLQAVVQDIAAHLADLDLSAATVGRRLELSGRYVHHLLDGTGFSFSAYVCELRLNWARKMLIDPLMAHNRIGDICAMAGFGDLSHFNRAFRARFGHTPKEARRFK